METTRTLGEFAKDLPRPAVMCAIVKLTGSGPQKVGARMWITMGRFYGTLGGGNLEKQVLEYARSLLTDGRTQAHLKEYVLCKDSGQCCGGRVEVFFEPVLRRRAICLFGAGHVGRATATVLSRMPFDVRVIDERPQWADPKQFPEDVEVRCGDPVQYAKARSWGADDAACIFTHNHDIDGEIVRYLLPLPLGYLGMIGSEHKAKVLLARFKSKKPAAPDWDALWDEKMHCPIGLPFESKDPKVIAVSIAAEVLQEWGLKRAPKPDVPASKTR